MPGLWRAASISVNCWPWEGAVALKETRDAMTHYHIIRNWLWLGAVESLDDATALLRTLPGSIRMVTKFSVSHY